MHGHAHILLSACGLLFMHACDCMGVCTRTHAWVRACTCVCLCMHVCVCTCNEALHIHQNRKKKTHFPVITTQLTYLWGSVESRDKVRSDVVLRHMRRWPKVTQLQHQLGLIHLHTQWPDGWNQRKGKSSRTNVQAHGWKFPCSTIRRTWTWVCKQFWAQWDCWSEGLSHDWEHNQHTRELIIAWNTEHK